MAIILQNGTVYTEQGFMQADVAFEDGRISGITPAASSAKAGKPAGADAIDAGGLYVLPGFVDIHTHGAAGHDFSDADAGGIETMLGWYGDIGVTSVLATTMSYSEAILSNIIKVSLPYFDRIGYGAVLWGVNMEGPFLSPQKCGAQNPAYIIPPDGVMFERLYTLAKGNIRLVDLAPELPGALDFIARASRQCAVSLAHSEADYDTARAAFEAGASHVTHLFNAMPPFTHRQPGLIGAAGDCARFVEVISDGLHLHPAVVRAVFHWFGPGRVCLVSDSMRATGLPNGSYDLGGQDVTVRDGKATLADDPGAIAGSVVPLPEMVRRAIRFGVPMEEAVGAATLNCAKAAGIEGEVGSIAPGKRADFLLWDRDLHTVDVLIGGQSRLRPGRS